MFICCRLCIDDFTPDCQMSVVRDCFHTFHAECLRSWIKDVKSCPICDGAFENPNFEFDETHTHPLSNSAPNSISSKASTPHLSPSPLNVLKTPEMASAASYAAKFDAGDEFFTPTGMSSPSSRHFPDAGSPTRASTPSSEYTTPKSTMASKRALRVCREPPVAAVPKPDQNMSIFNGALIRLFEQAKTYQDYGIKG